jgi:2',3'-cyclic-nucleotide 2'-phosphodiesterase/3'-nucleotidase
VLVFQLRAAFSMTKRLLVLLAGLALLPAVWAQQLKLRILETTDVHMYLLDYDYYQDKPTAEYGLARTATLIKQARAEVKNSLLFDNGDLLQGGPMGEYVARIKPLQAGQLHPAFKVMNWLGYDAANIGNHEFNYGLSFLNQSLTGAAFPYLNSNIYLEDGDGNPANDKNAYQPYVVLDRSFTDESGATQKLRIGVIGFVPPQVMVWDRERLTGKVTPRDIVQSAQLFLPRVKAEGADVVVLIAHSGFEFGESVFFAENAVAKLAELAGVNAILFGHSHGEFPGRFFASHAKADLQQGTINGVPAVMPGFWGSHLGVVDLVLDKTEGGWKASGGRAELRPIWDRATRKPLVDADPKVAELVAEEHAGTLAFMRAPLGESRAPIHTYFSLVGDDPSVQLIAQAQLAYAMKALAATPHAQLPLLSAASPFKTGPRGGGYVDIPAGPLSLRNAAEIYVYPNSLQAVQISGAQVREWLEMSALVYNRIDPQGPPEQNLINTAIPGYFLDTLDGVSYRIDVTQPARYSRGGKLVNPEAHRILDLRFQGQPIDEQARFVVVTNSHRAGGGDSFPGLDGKNIVLNAPDENREALVQYLKAAKVVDPSADDNWRIQPVPNVKLRFVSGSGGMAHLARYPRIALVKDNGDGSALYELKP